MRGESASPTSESEWRLLATNPEVVEGFAIGALDVTGRIRKLQSMAGDIAAHINSPAARSGYLTEIAVASFSESGTDILMWSHYADGHRGVCLQFDISPNSWLFRHTAPVVYTDILPRVLFGTHGNSGLGRTAALTKSAHWSYEHEWRSVDLTPNGQRIVDKAEITAIMMGAAISAEDEAKVRALAQARSPSMKLVRARASHDTYSLALDEL